MEANAALRTIVRRETGETYREMLKRMAAESGIETPSADDLVRRDRARRGKKLANADWVSRTDPDAKIARMKDGTTHLAYKPEHAVDLDTGAVVAAEIHPADKGDTTTLSGTLRAAAAKLAKVDRAPSTTDTAELVADRGYHSRAVLKELDGGVWKTRIAEPQRPAVLRWHGDSEARDAVYANRHRLRSAVGKAAMRRRAEIAERSFAHNLERGGMRRTWLRGRENVHKRYLIHVRPQPRRPDAPPDRRRNPERGRRPRPDVPARHLRRSHPGDLHLHPRRSRPRLSRRHRHHRANMITTATSS